MGIWQRIKSKVKEWVGGGSSKKATPPRARAIRSVSRGNTQATGYYRGGRAVASREEEERKKKKEQYTNAFKARKSETKDITEAVKKPSASKPKSVVERKQAIDANRANAQKKLDDLKAKRERKVQKERTYTNADGEKVVVRETKSHRAQGKVGGTLASDTAYRMKEMPKTQSFTRGLASGLSFGATDLEAKRLAKLNKDRAEAEKTYQKKKSKNAEMAGELAGSLVSFGATEGATKAIGEKAVSKVAPKAATKLAEKKIIQKAAKRSVDKAVKKGIAKGSGEELIKQVGKDKAKQVVNAIGSDVAQNLTTGAIYDINKASAEHKVGSKDWWKELGTSAAFNVGITGIVGGASAVKSSKGLVKDSMETLTKKSNLTKFARENSVGRALKRNAPRIGESIEERIARVDAERLGKEASNSASNARRISLNDVEERAKAIADSKGQLDESTAEILSGNKNIRRRADNEGKYLSRKYSELSSASEERIANRKPTKSESRLESLRDEIKQASQDMKEARSRGDDKAFGDAVDRLGKLHTEESRMDKNIARAKKARDERAFETAHKATDEYAAKQKARLEEILKSVDEPEATKAEPISNEQLRLDSETKNGKQLSLENEAKGNEQLSLEDEVAKETPASGNEQESLADKLGAVEENPASEKAKQKPPKTAKQKKQAETAEREYLDTIQRKREQKLNATVRGQTKGEYGYRQGEHTASAHSSLEHAKRIEEEQKTVSRKLRDEGVAEMFEDDEKFFGIFKTANKTELDKAASEATTRVRNDMHGAVKRLRELDERLKTELTKNSALASAEHITLDDVADIVAIRNAFDEAGESLPKEYEEAFAHIIEWQRTESAQGLKAIDLFLKENDASYRRAFLTRDIDRYMRKVLHADEKGIADIKRSLDANHGEGYYDKMIEELSKYTGAKNEAAFRKAYADFQAEIFMNTKPSVWDAVNLWRHSFMLSSPKTGANNIIGNLMQRTMYRISDAVNIAGESLAQSLNSEVKRTTAFLKSSDQRKLARMYTSGRRGKLNLKNENYLKGFDDQEFADAINMASDADVAEMMESSKYMGDVVKGLKYKPTTAAGKVKQGFIKGGRFGNELVSLMLNEPDSWFVERNYRTTLLKYLEANGINSSKALNTKEGEKLLKEARAYAKDVALENTYKKANNVVSFLEGLRTKGHTKGSGLGYKAGAIVLDAELPYLKVPANLIINNFKYSPIGVGKGALDAYKGIIKGDAELLNKATRELSKGLTGTGMAALGYMMFCRDQTDEDSWGFIGNAKDELKEYGVRDNSFKIGDHNFNIANMGIGSVQFLMGAALAEDLAENGQIPSHQIVLDALNKTVDTVADMSLMENAVSLLDMFGNGGDYEATVSDRLGNAATEVAGDYAAQFIPNPMRGVAKGVTDADLDTGVKKGDTTKVQRALERNKNNFIQGVPVLNEKVLPHKVDTHGRLVNEKENNRDKLKAILNNTLNPLSTNKVHIPEADKEEMKVKKESGEAFKPNGFDNKREYKSKVGKGKYADYVDLTGKEREQVARAAQNAGKDMATALIKKGMFGDRLGERAQDILANTPDNEEKARELFFSTPEWKNADNEQKEKWLEIMYGQGTHGDASRGVSRARNAEAYINIAGNSEGDFRYQNDLDWHYQKKYEENGFADMGIDKGTYADVVQAVYDYSHKWDEEKGNVDTPNSARKVKDALLSVEGLTTEQRIAIYQSYRGKRNGFGWYDWDGISGGSGGYRRRYGRRYGGYHSRRGGGSKIKAVKKSAFKADKATYKDIASVLKTRSSSSKSTAPTVKIEPPKVKFKKYEA